LGAGIVLWALCAAGGFLIFFQLLMETAGHAALGAFVFSYVPISAFVFLLVFFRSKSRRSKASNGALLPGTSTSPLRAQHGAAKRGR